MVPSSRLVLTLFLATRSSSPCCRSLCGLLMDSREESHVEHDRHPPQRLFSFGNSKRKKKHSTSQPRRLRLPNLLRGGKNLLKGGGAFVKQNLLDMQEETESEASILSMSEQDDVFLKKQKKNHSNDVLDTLMKNLLKGMTLPFPIFGSLVLGEMEREDADTVNISGLSSAFSSRDSLLYIAAYLLFGATAYSLVLEDWSVVDALYFSVTSFTTVGYGDLIPTTTLGKLFTCFYGLGGVAFLGAALASIGSNIVQAEIEALEAAEQASRQRIMDLFENMPDVVERVRKGGGNGTTDDDVSAHERQEDTSKMATLSPSLWSEIQKLSRRLVPSFCFLSLGGIVIGHLEGWSLVDSIYYAFITAGTVGYGDVSPTSPGARLWAVIFIPLAVAAAGDVLGTVASSFLEHRRRQVYESLVDQELTMKDLDIMDTDENGRVTRDEYVDWMLVQLNIVRKEQLEELYAQFDRLDVTRSGYLDEEDLKLMAKLKRMKS